MAQWVQNNLDTKILKAIKNTDKTTNLELLANQILFTNFCERDKPVHEMFKWLQDETQHFEIFDLLAQTNAADVEGSAYEDALKVIQEIRG